MLGVRSLRTNLRWRDLFPKIHAIFFEFLVVVKVLSESIFKISIGEWKVKQVRKVVERFLIDQNGRKFTLTADSSRVVNVLSLTRSGQISELQPSSNAQIPCFFFIKALFQFHHAGSLSRLPGPLAHPARTVRFPRAIGSLATTCVASCSYTADRCIEGYQHSTHDADIATHDIFCANNGRLK